jgi:2-deoxy-D-gluconate 3-dehydrogenase
MQRPLEHADERIEQTFDSIAAMQMHGPTSIQEPAGARPRRPRQSPSLHATRGPVRLTLPAPTDQESSAMTDRQDPFKNLFSLEGRVALVTGGSRGIGRMIAAGYLEYGAKVYISARKAEACDATAAELSRRGRQCISLPLDISTVEGCRQLAAEIKQREGKLDILVNNAGAAWGADFDEFPEHGWDKVMNLNVKSPFFLTQALHSVLRAAATEERPAKVINIASIDGIRLNPLETYSYHASKAALIYLTRRVAATLIKDKIVVTAIAPGPFASEMNRAARDHADQVAARTPLRRIGSAEDMAGAAIYLASRAGDYVVGDTIAVKRPRRRSSSRRVSISRRSSSVRRRLSMILSTRRKSTGLVR